MANGRYAEIVDVLRSVYAKKVRLFVTVDFISTLVDWFFLSFYLKFFKYSRFDRGSPLYEPHLDLAQEGLGAGTGGGCGMSTSLDPLREDPGAFVADLDFYLLSIELMSDYSGLLPFMRLVGTTPELRDMLGFGSTVVGQASIDTVLVFLIILLFLIVASILVMPLLGASTMQQAVVLELLALSMALFFIFSGLVWYDPMGQIFALFIVVVSSCEFIV